MRAVRVVITLWVASSLLLVSCAPTAPDQGIVPLGAYSDGHPDVHTRVPLAMSNVALVVDALISRDELGHGDYYVLSESRSASSWMLDSATSTLEAGRFRVRYTLAPFVGGFLGDGELADVAPEIGRTPWPKTSPFFISPAVFNDTAYIDALIAVLRQVASTDVQDMGPLATYAGSEVPAPPDWGLLYERLGTDYLLIAVAEGVSVSGGTEVSSACFSSCLSMAFSVLVSAICSSVTGADVEPDLEECAEIDIETLSTLRSTVQMFDTRTGYAVWSKTRVHSHIDPLSRSFYVTEWAPSLLEDIWYPPPRTR